MNAIIFTDDHGFSHSGFMDRLYLLMRREGIKKDNAFEKEIGMPGAMYRWKSGKDKPTPDSLLKISRRFRVSIDWLVTGQANWANIAESSATYDARTPAPVDAELIEEVLTAIFTYLNKNPLKISAKSLAVLAKMLYEYRITERLPVTDDIIKAYLVLTP